MRLPQLRQRLRDLGAAPCHEGRVLRAWVQGRSLDTKRRRAEDFLPLSLRNDLPGLFDELRGLARVHSEHADEDGSARLLVQLADGQTVESVLLPRDGLCVSTQVGCAVGCVFCMTGRAGLLRQVSSVEIVAQVVLARSRRTVKKVVFMGMGEPAHNLDNVLEAIELLGVEGGDERRPRGAQPRIDLGGVGVGSDHRRGVIEERVRGEHVRRKPGLVAELGHELARALARRLGGFDHQYALAAGRRHHSSSFRLDSTRQTSAPRESRTSIASPGSTAVASRSRFPRPSLAMA